MLSGGAASQPHHLSSDPLHRGGWTQCPPTTREAIRIDLVATREEGKGGDEVPNAHGHRNHRYALPFVKGLTKINGSFWIRGDKRKMCQVLDKGRFYPNAVSKVWSSRIWIRQNRIAFSKRFGKYYPSRLKRMKPW